MLDNLDFLIVDGRRQVRFVVDGQAVSPQTCQKRKIKETKMSKKAQKTKKES
jgi:hypothetical protein